MPKLEFKDIKITLSKRKTIALHIHEDGKLELRAPVGVNRVILEQMVESKRAWISRKQFDIAERKNKNKQICWDSGSEIPFSGKMLTLEYQFGKRTKVSQDADKLVIIAAVNSPEKLKKACLNWMGKIAQEHFLERTRFWKDEMYPQSNQILHVKPRKMSSRWGSCSKNKNIRLNTLLMMLPESLMDYVIVHELCHWQVFNHSQKFYRLLEGVLPNWKNLERQLKNHQYILSEARK